MHGSIVLCKILCISTLLHFGFCLQSWAQFSGPVGSIGSNAICKDSNVFHAWASKCTVVRGRKQLNLPDSGFVSAGNPQLATGKADITGIVSLGDKGTATIEIEGKIIDGTGADFAIFENAFSANFLELAFVEVSSDGVHFVRFPAVSNTQDSVQIGPFSNQGNASLLYNLAGKYKGGCGTPFDLHELKDSSRLDISDVRWIRIIDVGGSIVDSLASFDVYGKRINDPFPTPFPSGGFDLDAVGFIHFIPTQLSTPVLKNQLKYQTMNQNGMYGLQFDPNLPIKNIQLYTLEGKSIPYAIENQLVTFSATEKSLYFLQCTIENQWYHQKIEIW